MIPEHPRQIRANEVSLEGLRRSYLRNALANITTKTVTQTDLDYFVGETKSSREFVERVLAESDFSIST